MTENINIEFPFKDSSNGEYLKLTKTTMSAIKSDLMHIILTDKGERLYLPNFGTNLKKYIFEPLDEATINNIKIDIQKVVSDYIPNLIINNIQTEKPFDRAVKMTIFFTITDNVFETRDSITIDFY